MSGYPVLQVSRRIEIPYHAPDRESLQVGRRFTPAADRGHGITASEQFTQDCVAEMPGRAKYERVHGDTVLIRSFEYLFRFGQLGRLPTVLAADAGLREHVERLLPFSADNP